jgi:hypothetical protein
MPGALLFMKAILTTLFLVITILVRAQDAKDLLLRKWMAVFSRPVGDNWYSPIDGTILDIKKESITIGNTLSDSSITFKYNVRRGKIKMGDESLGTILFLSNDSLVLDFDKRMRTKFIPIEDFKPELDQIDLSQNAWVLKWSDGDYSINRRIDFTNERWYAGDGPRVAITHEKAMKYKYQDNEKWTLKRIQQEWFLTLTQNQMDPLVYQVIKYDGDSLTLRGLSWSTKKAFILHRLKRVEPLRSDSICQYLSKQRWETGEILSYATSISEHSPDIEPELGTGFYARDTTLIKKSDLIGKRLSFTFRPDFVFQIHVDANLFSQTKWRLSSDGAYVIINDGQHPYDYIEIISMKNDELVIGKSDNFATDTKREYFPYYYEVRLKKPASH